MNYNTLTLRFGLTLIFEMTLNFWLTSKQNFNSADIDVVKQDVHFIVLLLVVSKTCVTTYSYS